MSGTSLEWKKDALECMQKLHVSAGESLEQSKVLIEETQAEAAAHPECAEALARAIEHMRDYQKSMRRVRRYTAPIRLREVFGD